jgi:NAD(P) transhydrogenase
VTHETFSACCAFLLLPACTAAALLGGWAVGRYLGLDEVTSATYLVSSALCIAAIACLSQQSSARTGNALGLIGVSGGIAATLGGLNTDPGTYAQVVGSLAAGGLVGNQIASRINITDLPQMVAAYHSLVGLAAAITSIANIMLLADAGHEMDGVHMVTAFLGDIIGAITLTGSVSCVVGLELGRTGWLLLTRCRACAQLGAVCCAVWRAVTACMR